MIVTIFIAVVIVIGALVVAVSVAGQHEKSNPATAARIETPDATGGDSMSIDTRGTSAAQQSDDSDTHPADVEANPGSDENTAGN